jgi:hypothetical protein
MVNDIQSRIRELIKALTREFMEIHEKNARIGTSRTLEKIAGKWSGEEAEVEISYRLHSSVGTIARAYHFVVDKTQYLV